MPQDFRSLQERLRQRLLQQIAAGELTGLELARETGFQQAHISNFLNRKRGLSLEAMDAILTARNLTVAGLLAEKRNSPPRRRSLQASSPGLSYIPLLTAENLYANDVPYSEAKNALAVMSARLEKLRPEMRTPRHQWRRFVAMRVSPADARAMAPRLAPGSTVVIDRHSNGMGAKRSIYAVRHADKVVLRYVERVRRELVLRPEDAEAPLMRLESMTAIMGRVCLVMTEM